MIGWGPAPISGNLTLDVRWNGPRKESAFDSVRGLFPEGEELYPGAGFKDRTHIQIAVCNPDRILGLFYPPDYPPG
jgi:hypothetical protein